MGPSNVLKENKEQLRTKSCYTTVTLYFSLLIQCANDEVAKCQAITCVLFKGFRFRSFIPAHHSSFLFFVHTLSIKRDEWNKARNGSCFVCSNPCKLLKTRMLQKSATQCPVCAENKGNNSRFTYR